MISPSQAVFVPYQQSGAPGRAQCILKSPFRIRLEEVLGKLMLQTFVSPSLSFTDARAIPLPGRNVHTSYSPAGKLWNSNRPDKSAKVEKEVFATTTLA